MFQQCLNCKKFIFSTFVLLTVMFLFSNRILFAQTLLVGNQQQAGKVEKPETTNDFNNDVRLDLQNLALNPAAQAQQIEIGSQDYKSTWDEFGTNIFVDGTMSPLEINKVITEDIVRTIQTEESYDQKEMEYLDTIHTTPEEIKTIEESTGSDVPPAKFTDPNPSAEENPEASIPASEDQGQNNSGETAPAENATTTEMVSVTPETNTSTSEATTSSEGIIFDAIMQGELVNPSPESASPSPSELLPEPIPPTSEPPPAE